MSDFLIASRQFVVEDGVAGTITIAAGERVAFDHPVVRRFPDAFETDDQHKRRKFAQRQAEDPRNREAGTDFSHRGSPSRTEHDPAGESRDGALRVIDGFTKSGELRSDAADRLDAFVRRDKIGLDARYLEAVADPAYASAFGKVVMDPSTGHLRHTPEEVEAFRRVVAAEEQRAMSIGTTTAGGFAVPFTLDPSVMLTSSGALNPIRELATTFTVGTDQWKGVSSAGVSAVYQAEAAAVTDASPTLAQPTIDCAMWRCFVPFSIELGQDWSTLQPELARLISDGVDVLNATQFLTGSGTDAPAGVITGLSTSQRIQCAGAGFPVVADHYSLKAAIPARFMGNTTWVAHPAQWDRSYRLTPAGSTTEPQMLTSRDSAVIGRPKAEWSTMANVSTVGSKLIIAGDFQRAFYIADRVGMTVEVIPHLFGAAQGNLPTGQRGLFAYGRTGSKVVVPEALRYLETI